jgi:hypothetical protein
LGNIYLDSHAFWIEECSTNLLANSEYGILWIPRSVHEIVSWWFQCIQWLQNTPCQTLVMFWQMLWIQYQLESREVHFLVYLGVILGYVVSKAWKLFDLKNILVIMNMLASKTPKYIQGFHGMALFNQCFIKNFAFIMAPITNFFCKIEVFVWTVVSRSVGGHKINISRCTNLNYTQMRHGVSCPHKCVKSSNQGDVGSESYLKMWSTNYICLQTLEQCREKLNHHQKRSTHLGLHFA